jgi:hypothetical protein
VLEHTLVAVRRSDGEVQAIEEQARAVFPNTVAATCGFAVSGGH